MECQGCRVPLNSNIVNWTRKGRQDLFHQALSMLEYCGSLSLSYRSGIPLKIAGLVLSSACYALVKLDHYP